MRKLLYSHCVIKYEHETIRELKEEVRELEDNIRSINHLKSKLLAMRLEVIKKEIKKREQRT